MDGTYKFASLLEISIADPSKSSSPSNASATPRPLRSSENVNQDSLRKKLETTTFRLSDGLNAFGRKVYSILSNRNSGNVVVSPFLLYTALSTVFFGSPSDSQTHKELSRDHTNTYTHI